MTQNGWHTPERRDLWLIAGLFGCSLVLRAFFAVGFDGLYGQDAYAYYNFAGELGRTFEQGTRLPPFFWSLGYPALLAAGFAVFGATPLTAQAISLVFGGLIPALVYVLARQMGAKTAGALAAGLIAAVCGQAIQSSIVVMADIPALFWATASAVCLMHYITGSEHGRTAMRPYGTIHEDDNPSKSTIVSQHTDGRRWLAAAALLLALACVTRWLYLALIPVWGAALVLTWRGARWRETLIAGGAAALVLLPQVAISVGSPYPVLNHAWVEGWQAQNAFRQQFDNVDGHFDYAQMNAVFYGQPFYDAYYLAPPFAPFALAGAWMLRRERVKLVMLLGWAVLPYLFLAGIPYQNIRFALIVTPPIAVLAGMGLGWLFERQRVVYAAVLVGGLALSVNAALPTIHTFVGNQMNDKAAVAWALARVPAEARLYAFGLTQPLMAYAPFEVHELYNETPKSIQVQQSDGKDSYLLLNVWQVEHQWAGRPLEATYQWLRDTVGLEYLDRNGNYLLFRIAYEDRFPTTGVQRAVG